jgi:hypothetical protein
LAHPPAEHLLRKLTSVDAFHVHITQHDVDQACYQHPQRSFCATADLDDLCDTRLRNPRTDMSPDRLVIINHQHLQHTAIVPTQHA